MAENLIPQIAQMLGVELGEEFKVKGEDVTYRFTNDGLVFNQRDGFGLELTVAAKAKIDSLLNGNDEIIKIPWKPKIYDIYWTFKAAHLDVWCITATRWTNNPNDVAAFKNGWVYRSKKEAKAALPNVAKELGVEYEL